MYVLPVINRFDTLVSVHCWMTATRELQLVTAVTRHQEKALDLFFLYIMILWGVWLRHQMDDCSENCWFSLFSPLEQSLTHLLRTYTCLYIFMLRHYCPMTYVARGMRKPLNNVFLPYIYRTFVRAIFRFFEMRARTHNMLLYINFVCAFQKLLKTRNIKNYNKNHYWINNTVYYMYNVIHVTTDS